jgi:hypothetical protein
MLIDNERGPHPDSVTLEGSFGMTKGIDGVPYLDVAAIVATGGGLWDSIIESNEGAAPLGQHVDPGLLVRSVGDAAAAAAELDFAAAGLTNLDGVLTFGTAGLAGNDWTASVGAGSGLGVGVQVYEDVVNKTLTILFEDGVSTQGDLATAVGGTANFTVVGGTGAAVLDVTDDDMPSTSLAGGAAQEYVDEDANGWVTVHFEPTATTVTEIEAAIAAHAAAGGRIKVQTAGTGVSVLNANDAFDYTLLSDGYAVDQVGFGCQSVMRTAVGTYVLTLDESVASRVHANANIQLATAADQVTQLGPWVNATKKQTIFIWDKSGGALADVAYAAGNKIHWSVSVKMNN